MAQSADFSSYRGGGLLYAPSDVIAHQWGRNFHLRYGILDHVYFALNHLLLAEGYQARFQYRPVTYLSPCRMSGTRGLHRHVKYESAGSMFAQSWW